MTRAERALERVQNLIRRWEQTDPQGLLSKRRAAHLIQEVIDDD